MKKDDADKKKQIERYLADAIIERPYGFSVGESHYSLYPVTLGKMYVLQSHIEELDINIKLLSNDISLEALRLVHEKKELCLHIIYIHTCRTKDELFNTKRMTETTTLFLQNMSEEDIAVLMILVLSSDRTDSFIKHLGIDREQQRMQKISDVKARNSKNSVHIGGKSIYGAFIAPLIEMGLSWDEILWQRSYANLRLLLADKVSDVYLTDEEAKHLPAWVRGGGQYIKADDPKNKDLIKSMNWK